MQKILCTSVILFFGAVTFAQQSDPVNLQEIDKPLPPKVMEPAPPVAYTIVDEMPEFPGGMSGMQRYLSSNIRYPSGSRKKNIEGKVVVKFIVDEEGSIVDELVTRSVSEDIDAEAVRVIKAMPKWKPGILNGQPVKVFYTLPISFKLG